MNQPLLNQEPSNEEINHQLNEQLIQACYDGDLAKVRYWLTDPQVGLEYGLHADIHAHNDALICACEKGHDHIVQYLLKSPELKEHAWVNARNNGAIIGACLYGQLNVVKELLGVKLGETNHIVDIHARNDAAFEYVCAGGFMDIATYLVFEYHIEKTPAIQQLLPHYPAIEQLFERRQFHQHLHDSLHCNEYSRKNKI